MTIRSRIEAARERIDRAAAAAGRTDTVTIELAAKTQTSETCREAAQSLADIGLPVLLGHNRVQEARATAEAIREVPGAEIHLIGPLQTNKINQALRCVDAIETIDSPELAAAVDQRAPGELPVFVQVNVSGEESKHGCSPDGVDRVVEAVVASENLRLRGFMTIGLHSEVEKAVRAGYSALFGIRSRVAQSCSIDEGELALSMGMSEDAEWAIFEGATIVRLGKAVFGPRPEKGQSA